MRKSSEEVHVGHGVSTDSNVSADSSSSEVSSVDGSSSEDAVGVGETLLGMVMVDSSLVSVMGMDASTVSPDSVVVGRASVLSKEVGSRSDGVVVTTSPDGTDLEHVSVLVESGSLTFKPVDSVGVGLVSVGNGVSVSVDSSNHLFVSNGSETSTVVVSVVPDTGDVSSTSVRNESSVSGSDGAVVVVSSRDHDASPVMVVTQPVFAESVMVVSDSGRVVSSFGHLVSVNSGSSGGVMVMDHDFVGMVVSSFGVEVSVDRDVSVTGEFHVLSTEGSLSLSVAGPVFPVGKETHVHVGFLGNLVASALRFLGFGFLGLGFGSDAIKAVIVPYPALFAAGRMSVLNPAFFSVIAIPAFPQALLLWTISVDEELASL